jgi:hypothetical protein
MTKRRPRFADPERFSPRILDVYRRVRQIYEECETDQQTVALKACSDEGDKLYALLGRNPWDVELFTCIDNDRPPIWEKRVDDWNEAKKILAALEKAAVA